MQFKQEHDINTIHTIGNYTMYGCRTIHDRTIEIGTNAIITTRNHPKIKWIVSVWIGMKPM